MKPTLLAAAVLTATGSMAHGEQTVSAFAANVSTHVLYHELAYAVLQDFKIPVLANEVVTADSFATLWLTQQKREIAPQVVRARVMSWVYEDGKIDPIDYDFEGEHPIDIRRAFQVACLIYGADPATWVDQVSWLGIADYDLAECTETAPVQISGWDAVLTPLLLPDGALSENVEVIFGEGPMKEQMMNTGVLQAFGQDMRRLNWPAPIAVQFDHCDEGANWNPENRTILLCDTQVQRFVDQGEDLGE